jgi:hypothetical protein
MILSMAISVRFDAILNPLHNHSLHILVRLGRNSVHAGIIWWRRSGESQSARLREFDGGNRPPAIVASDRDSQAMHFVKANAFHRSSLSVGEYHGLADKLSLGSLELVEDGGCMDLRSSHDDLESRA